MCTSTLIPERRCGARRVRAVGLTHFDQAERAAYAVGHIQGTWSFLGDGAGSVTVGLSRLQVADGGWSTPVHEHGREEEIFYVLDGRGLSIQDGRAAEVRPGDCIVYLPGKGAHSLHGIDGLDVLAFGQRFPDEAPRFPRSGLSRIGNRAVETMPGSRDGEPIQWLREAELGPPELPDGIGPRPSTITNLADVEAVTVERPRVVRTRRHVSRAAGSVRTGLQHVEVAPGKESTAQHCHSVEEELFVVLDGDGVLVLDDEELPVRAGQVICRPAATGVCHMFRAGPSGMTYLAYGPREPADMCYYRRSNKIAFRGVHLIARLERLEYWDGED
jgi:uncharacterized cupin superfamily protein